VVRAATSAGRLPVAVTPLQRSLFPDAYEVQADALDALNELDIDAGLACVREARRRDPTLPNLDALDAALIWLRSVIGSEPARAESAAAAFLALPASDLSVQASGFVDLAVARFGLRCADGDFLDAERRVPEAALRLVLGQFEAARRGLARLLDRTADRDGHDRRADLWGWRADACFACDRPEEAGAAWVRALLLDPDRIDLFRTRAPRWRTLFAELRVDRAEAEARALLFPHAWLRGLVEVPVDNDWLDAHLPRLRAATRVATDAPRADRLLRFALLLYEDRSRPGPPDIAQREEMQALEPELFQQVVAVLRERERG